MGLLWAVLDGSGPLLLEEPELSLHSDVVSVLPELFARIQRRSKRQIVVSTHSPDLLRGRGIGLDEVVVLQPGLEGTVGRLAANFSEIRDLLDGGIELPEAVIPFTRPDDVDQLSLFGDS